MKSSQRHLHNFLLKTLCPLSPLSVKGLFFWEKRPLNSTQYSIVRPLPHINATRNVGNNVQFYFNQRGNFERTIRTSDDHCQSVGQSVSQPVSFESIFWTDFRYLFPINQTLCTYYFYHTWTYFNSNQDGGQRYCQSVPYQWSITNRLDKPCLVEIIWLRYHWICRPPLTMP